MKRKYTVMINYYFIHINKTNNYFSPQIIEHKKNMSYDVWNSSSGLGQAHKRGRVKLVNGITTPNQISSINTDLCKQTMKKHEQMFFHSKAPHTNTKLMTT